MVAASWGCLTFTAPIAAQRLSLGGSKITAFAAVTTAGFMTEVANVWSSLPNRKTAPSRTVSSTRPIMPGKRLALCSRTSVRSRCHCYDLLVRSDGCRVVGGGEEFCNWLQRAENSADGAHSIALHAAGYPNMAMNRPTINSDQTPFRIKETTWVEGVSKPRITHFIFPSHVRHSAARVGENPRQVIRFRVPTDDFKTTTYWLDFYRHKDGQPTQPVPLKTQGFKKSEPGV